MWLFLISGNRIFFILADFLEDQGIKRFMTSVWLWKQGELHLEFLFPAPLQCVGGWILCCIWAFPGHWVGSIPARIHTRLGAGQGPASCPKKGAGKHCLEVLPTFPNSRLPPRCASREPTIYHASDITGYSCLILYCCHWWSFSRDRMGEKRLLSSLAAAAGWMQGGWAGGCTATGVFLAPGHVWG